MGTNRRTVITTAAGGISVLAGCSSGTEREETENGNGNGDDDDGNGDSHSVEMESVGTVEFSSVPETWLAYDEIDSSLPDESDRPDGLLLWEGGERTRGVLAVPRERRGCREHHY